MDKVRVYELARELGMTSPETIALLKEKLKIRVKSASSTIEEDTAIKLKRLLRLEGASARRRRLRRPKLSLRAPAKTTPSRRASGARRRLGSRYSRRWRRGPRCAREGRKAAREKEERERREAEEAAAKLSRRSASAKPRPRRQLSPS